jgi:hypothetical protein
VSWLLQLNESTHKMFFALKTEFELNAQDSAMAILRPLKSMN